MKIALAQLSLSRDVNQNLDKALKAMDEAAEAGAQVICFPEIQFSPFFPQHPKRDVEHYAHSIDHQVIKRLQEKCVERNLVAIPNLYLTEAGKRFDASPVIEANGEILGVSKMVHIVQAPCFYEQDYYAPSDTGFKVYNTSVGRIGVIICFDRHFPESFRACALQGAELIVIPTANTKSEPMEMFEWELRIPAMQNGVFIAMCNRVGQEDAMDFSGESLVVDPDGGVLAKADDTEQLLLADVDLEHRLQSKKMRPYLELRRAETYP